MHPNLDILCGEKFGERPVSNEIIYLDTHVKTKKIMAKESKSRFWHDCFETILALLDGLRKQSEINASTHYKQLSIYLNSSIF